MSERQQSRPQTIWLRVACWDGNSPLVTAEVNLAMRLRRISSLLVENGFSQRILITRRLSFSLGMTQLDKDLTFGAVLTKIAVFLIDGVSDTRFESEQRQVSITSTDS